MSELELTVKERRIAELKEGIPGSLGRMEWEKTAILRHARSEDDYSTAKQLGCQIKVLWMTGKEIDQNRRKQW